MRGHVNLVPSLGTKGMDFMTGCMTVGVRVLLETESF